LAIFSDAGAKSILLEGAWDYKVEVSFNPKNTGPKLGPGNPSTPTVLYNAMIALLTPYAIRGAIWYQGESNAERAYQYRTLFPLMIRDWRNSWGLGAFPFYFVQLANFKSPLPWPGESDWAELREAQLMTLKQLNTGMAVTIDIGEAKDIHPRNKQDVGRRLAMIAFNKTYGQTVEDSGPVWVSRKIEGHRVRLGFDHVTRGLMTRDHEPPRGFAVAGEDRKFVWAEARIEGDTVVVWNDQVSHPIAVRYGWASNPVCNLYNGAGLPASPFRTDDWPGVTAGNE
jgi:sialate O-acetylesterase